MNQDNINNIQNAINYLRSAKTDKNKELITYAIDYINKAINGIKNEVVENEVPYISTYYIKPIVKSDEDVMKMKNLYLINVNLIQLQMK